MTTASLSDRLLVAESDRRDAEKGRRVAHCAELIDLVRSGAPTAEDVARLATLATLLGLRPNSVERLSRSIASIDSAVTIRDGADAELAEAGSAADVAAAVEAERLALAVAHARQLPKLIAALDAQKRHDEVSRIAKNARDTITANESTIYAILSGES